MLQVSCKKCVFLSIVSIKKKVRDECHIKNSSDKLLKIYNFFNNSFRIDLQFLTFNPYFGAALLSHRKHVRTLTLNIRPDNVKIVPANWADKALRSSNLTGDIFPEILVEQRPQYSCWMLRRSSPASPESRSPFPFNISRATDGTDPPIPFPYNLHIALRSLYDTKADIRIPQA